MLLMNEYVNYLQNCLLEKFLVANMVVKMAPYNNNNSTCVASFPAQPG